MFPVGYFPKGQFAPRYFPPGAAAGGDSFVAQFQESVGVVDVVSRSTGYSKAFAAAVGITDAAVYVVGRFRAVALAAAVGATDTIARIDSVFHTAIIENAVSVTDAFVRLFTGNRVQRDQEGASEATQRLHEALREVQDNHGSEDRTDRSAGYDRSAQDTAGITDFIKRVLNPFAETRVAQRLIKMVGSAISMGRSRGAGSGGVNVTDSGDSGIMKGTNWDGNVTSDGSGGSTIGEENGD